MGQIRFDLDGDIGIVTLDRPERLNALDNDMHEQLAATWRRLKERDDVRAVVVTGVGRGFCVGMDLHQVSANGGFRPVEFTRLTDVSHMTAMANDIWLPTIIAVNGVCAGGGLHFVADADVVICSEDARFLDPHVTVGQVSALEPISLVPRIGLGNALKLSVLGRGGEFDAADALRVGLVSEVVPAGQLMDRAMQIARLAAASSPAAVERTKRAIWESLDLPMREALQRGWESLMAHRDHPDALEGPRAFAEKRRPNWLAAGAQDG